MKINWQNGVVLYEGNYLVTVMKQTTGETFVSTDYYDFCDGWTNYGEGTPYKVMAFYQISEIEPYINPVFKIGQFVVENQIVGTVTAVLDNLELLVIGRNLKPLVFSPDKTRLATSEEALEISAHYRELGYYYSITQNSFLKC